MPTRSSSRLDSSPEGFALEECTVALDEIAQVGPGGSFLLSDSTLESFRKAYYRSNIFPYYVGGMAGPRENPKLTPFCGTYTMTSWTNSAARGPR